MENDARKAGTSENAERKSAGNWSPQGRSRGRQVQVEWHKLVGAGEPADQGVSLGCFVLRNCFRCPEGSIEVKVEVGQGDTKLPLQQRSSQGNEYTGRER